MIILLVTLSCINLVLAKNGTADLQALKACESKIKCPAIEAPLCVRVVKNGHNNTTKKSLHIVVLNKCEIQYMKCHKDMDAAIVPMKNCDSGQGLTDIQPTGSEEAPLGDWKEFGGDCPTACPARDMMLCARCSHNVYRTFLSVCHMRAFACKQKPGEKLELVSRFPCGASAPLLTHLQDPEVRLAESADEDPVLQFVYCRLKDFDGQNNSPNMEKTKAMCKKMLS